MTRFMPATCWTAHDERSGSRKGEPADFQSDEVLVLALTHLLQIIGEAARCVGPEYRALHPGVPWTEIVGMRHRVVHDYLNIDEDTVWDVVERDLVPLIAALEQIAL